MKNVKGLTLLALMAILLMSPLFVTQVAATDIHETPINKTLMALPGTNFVLVHKMEFQEAGEAGYFSTTFYWDNNETDPDAKYWNFTLIDIDVKFTDGTAFSGTIENSTVKKVPSGYPAGYYRYTVSISETYGEMTDKQFWVNVTMKNAGVQGGVQYDHAAGDQNITIVKVRCNEIDLREAGPGDVRIRAGTHDVAVTAVTRSVPKEKLKPPTATDLDVMPGWAVYVNVTVKNVGDFTESFSVKAYYDNTPIGTKSVTNLAPGASVRLDFKWTPSDALVKFYWTTTKKYKTYPVKGEAILGTDVNPGNDVLVDGKVAVVYIADVNKDGTVSGGDLVGVGGHWGEKPGDPGYLALADINFDAVISGGDLVGIGGHWGDTAPDP